MPITANDLRWFKSERMTDEDDGGGRLTSQEIVFGVENQIFDDLSDVDRAAGDVSIRKVFAGVASLDDSKYLDACVAVVKPPADAAVTVTAFSTEDYYDERADIASALESYIVRGARWNGWLWGDHYAGQKAVVLWQRMTDPYPEIGARIELVASGWSQFLWVAEVTATTVTRVDGSGPYQVRQVVLGLVEALRYDFTGVEPSRSDPASSGLATKIYDSRANLDPVEMVGIHPLTEVAAPGDYDVQVESLYSPILATAFAETPIADETPHSNTKPLVKAAPAAISWTTALAVVAPGASLHINGPVFPGSLTVSYGGSVLSDKGGLLVAAGDVEVGSIDYESGVCTWTELCPNWGTQTKTVAYIPAATPIRVSDTGLIAVTAENRGFTWVRTLVPAPAPKTVRVAYQVNGEWYELTDAGGNGQLTGGDSRYGSGTINYETGTVTVTTGEIADIDSAIFFAWSTEVICRTRGGQDLPLPKVRGTTAEGGIRPGSFSIEWDGGSVTDNSQGVLSGTGGSGRVWYGSGDWELTLSALPDPGAELEINYQSYQRVTETFSQSVDGSGYFTLVLAQTPEPGTITITWDGDTTRPLNAEVDPFIYYPSTAVAVDQNYNAGTNTSEIWANGGNIGSADFGTGTLNFYGMVLAITQVPHYNFYSCDNGPWGSIGGD